MLYVGEIMRNALNALFVKGQNVRHLLTRYILVNVRFLGFITVLNVGTSEKRLIEKVPCFHRLNLGLKVDVRRHSNFYKLLNPCSDTKEC